ncbi:composite domain of metallo-dependent hydrolase [Pilatotrama ljubarskyi]|nr:composite domain of metallo-dependent hydrolase [Pilatotrama ljubarskyi]
METKGRRLLQTRNSPLTQSFTLYNSPGLETTPREHISRLLRPRYFIACAVSLIALTLCASYIPLLTASFRERQSAQRVPLAAQDILRRCAGLRAVPGPLTNFLARDRSDRFEPGTRATLIKNVTLWTGARNGTEIVYGDILLDKGLVRGIGDIPESLYAEHDTDVVDAKGGWVTPGLVDLHTHLGLMSAPLMAGALDYSSSHGPILPWLRSVDGLNTHDEGFALAVAGGVTSVQVVPGNENVIGESAAFMVKLRKTAERSPTSMLIEPPYALNGSKPDPNLPLRWRHLKQACGESVRAYGNRMDTMWALRSAYAEARSVRDAQDAFCARAEAGLWNEIEGQDYPGDVRWEALVDVLRGRVKVSTHCSEEVDLDAIVRLTQEFRFPIASIHGAHEAYLTPGVLKKTYGGIPTIALFADNSRYKREAYRGSEFAPRILADNGFPVVMKSDHPELNSRYLQFEAQQAHYYAGLPPHLALASVTSVPAAAAGLLHRIGILREGADADVVLWDSHPLQLGATPRKVWIDGILQVGNDSDHILIGPGKTAPEWQEPPEVPEFDREREAVVKWDGLPPLASNRTIAGRVAFRNVKEVFLRQGGDSAGVVSPHGLDGEAGVTHVIVDRGRVTCVGPVCEGEGRNAEAVMDLRGGTIAPGMMSFGSALGIEEIESEPSSSDGTRFEPLREDVPRVLGDIGAVVRVDDALAFGTRNALIAHRAGVTYATTSFVRSPLFLRDKFMGGLSATFRTGAPHALDRTAIIKPITALHVSIGRAPPASYHSETASLSTQIATLRHLLLEGEDPRTQTGEWFKKAADGTIPLVIDVSSADIMATLIRLKNEVEEKRGTYMRMVFSRATEAHLLAEEIAHAGVGVILSPARQFPWSWDDRKILAGPPLTNDTALAILLKHEVTVALGVWEAYHVQQTRFDVGMAILDSNNWINKRQAYELVSTNLEKLLDLEGWIGDMGDLVAYEGGSALDFTSKPVAIASPARALVEVL